MKAKTGFEWLLHYEGKVKKLGVLLPKDKEVEEKFVGIGFKIGDFSFLVKTDEVSEIVDVPECTKVGGAKFWFLGLANVRGSLLPVTDLHGFLFDELLPKVQTEKVLIYKKYGFFVGLKVDAILGMQRFLKEEQATSLESINDRSKPFVDAVYGKKEHLWSVFNIKKLASDKDFLQII